MRFDPKDIVEHLRHNLERYPYGNGSSVLRELLQNADDTKACQVAGKGGTTLQQFATLAG